MVITTLNVGDQPRLHLQSGDFFADSLPRADAHILMEVLHDWTDDQCIAILNAVRRAAPDNATVLAIEDIVPKGNPGVKRARSRYRDARDAGRTRTDGGRAQRSARQDRFPTLQSC
jgi:hypothetical protein